MKKGKNERDSMSLTYGPREIELWKEIDELSAKQILPKNKNEILRRGLHSCRYLADVDEEPLLKLVSSYLHSYAENHKLGDLACAKSLSLATYCTLIAKYGVLRAELFETIPINLIMLEKVLEESNDSKTISNVESEVEKLANSIDTIFLKHQFKIEYDSSTKEYANTA